MAKRNGEKHRLRISVDCSHNPQLYERIVKAAQRNFHCENPPVGKFLLKVTAKYLDERGDEITNGL